MPPSEMFVAQALGDKLGIKPGQQRSQQAPAAQPQPQDPTRAAYDNMLAERSNPKGRRMDRLAAWLGSGGGGGTPGQIGARQVAAGQQMQEGQRRGIESLVGPELDRRNQAGIYNMREGAANQRATMDILGRLQLANTEQNQQLVQDAYESLTSIGNPEAQALMQQIQEVTADMPPERVPAERERLIRQAVEQRVRSQQSVYGSVTGGGQGPTSGPQVTSIQKTG